MPGLVTIALAVSIFAFLATLAALAAATAGGTGRLGALAALSLGAPGALMLGCAVIAAPRATAALFAALFALGVGFDITRAVRERIGGRR